MAPAASPDEYDDDELAAGRWSRGRGPHRSRRWLLVLLLGFVIPLLIGAVVALFAGRPIAFEAVRRLTVRKFPQVQWIDRADLAQWRRDPARPQPVLLDARTEDEYAVSHLDGAVRIDPYRPLLRPLRGFSKDTAIAVYGSVGYRGARVARWLAEQGYTRVYNVEGGVFQWANEGRLIVRNGRPVTEVHPYDPNWGLMLDGDYRIDAPPVEKRSAAP